MEEKKYHIPDNELDETEGMLGEPAPPYRNSAVAEPVMYSSNDWEKENDDEFNTDSYPMGRSLEQVMAHCAEIDEHLDDPNYGRPVKFLNAKLLKMAERWR